MSELVISGCGDMLHHKNKSHYSYNKNHEFNIIQEYISRIGKRLLIVNNTQSIANLNIVFCLDNSDIPSLAINYEPKSKYDINNIITISKGLLHYLQDEAELATILAIALETIRSNDFVNLNFNIAISADNRIIQNLYQAGYDPSAFIELQEEYLKNKSYQENWLNFLFSPINITNPRIYANKKILLKVPKGLQRGKQLYLSNMYLLKK